MKYSQPVVLTICFSGKIQQRVIEYIDKKSVIAIHLDKDTFNKVSLTTIREIGFDLIIFDDEFLKDNPVSKLRSILPKTRLLAVLDVLDGNGRPGRVEYELGSALKNDTKDVAEIYKPDYCATIESFDSLFDYLLFPYDQKKDGIQMG